MKSVPSTYISDLLVKLSKCPTGFLAYYPNHLNNKWFFVPFNESHESFLVNSFTCTELEKEGIIISNVKDVEFRAQFAVGSLRYRTYRLSKDYKNCKELLI